MQRAGPLQRDRQVHLHRPLRGGAMGEEMHRTSAQLSNPIPFFIGKLQEKEKEKKKLRISSDTSKYGTPFKCGDSGVLALLPRLLQGQSHPAGHASQPQKGPPSPQKPRVSGTPAVEFLGSHEGHSPLEWSSSEQTLPVPRHWHFRFELHPSLLVGFEKRSNSFYESVIFFRLTMRSRDGRKHFVNTYPLAAVRCETSRQISSFQLVRVMKLMVMGCLPCLCRTPSTQPFTSFFFSCCQPLVPTGPQWNTSVGMSLAPAATVELLS